MTEHTSPTGDVGPAGVKIKLDEETYDHLREAYGEATEQGYDEPFHTFVLNRVEWSPVVVTAGGEVVGGKVE